jgi:hypothetical protein
LGIDDVHYLEGRLRLLVGTLGSASLFAAGLMRVFFDWSGQMHSIQTLREIRDGWLIKMLWLFVVLIGVFVVAPNRVQACSVQPLSESEVVQQIQRYCTVSWRNANLPRAEWGDCSQQLFCELLQRVHRQHLELAIAHDESDERRELNRAIWRIIKRQRRSDARSMLHMSWHDPSHSAREKEADDLLADVIHIGKHALSARQFCIVQMASEGYTIADIAKHLSIPVARASDEKYRSIRKIRESFNAE